MVILTVFLLCGFAIVVMRLFVLQVLSAGYYKALAEDQYNFFKKLTPNRGEIKITDTFSAEGYTVATNVKKNLVYVVPKDIMDNTLTATHLAPIVEMEVADIEGKLSDKSRQYVIVKRQLTEDQEEKIRALKLPGINFEPEVVRFYPEKKFLSNVLGFVGYKDTEKIGLYGLEKSFEKELAGRPGTLSQERDTTGAWIFGGKREFHPAQDGNNLILTIDRSIQFKAQTVIEETVTKHSADSGCILVMNPGTGGVLAMASFPNFDPNEYNKVEDPAAFNNICSTGTYEPGSIFKAITMAAAVDTGKVNSNTTYVDTGEVKIDGYTIKNSDNKAHGVQTMTQVLEQSLNTGVIFAQKQVGEDIFLEYVKKFGFGKKTGIELPETEGDLKNLNGTIAVNFHTASFGQGISVTPLQMVQSYSVFANSGKMVHPYIVQAQITPTGETISAKPPVIEQVVSEKTASTITTMLVNVVENGHGNKAKVAGYYVAGKTGTAQVPRKDGKGYEPNNNIGSFIGFAPASDPKFVMLVRVNHPRTVQFAESTAGPAFGEMAQFILNYYNIPPTRK